jgi:hypothetical protein
LNRADGLHLSITNAGASETASFEIPLAGTLVGFDGVIASDVLDAP